MKTKQKWQFILVQTLTLARVPLIAVFLCINLLAPKPLSANWFMIAFAALILSAATDLFDGYFARKFDVTTRLGAYADPLTDKIFYLTALPTLIFLAGISGKYFHSQLLLALAILFLARDQWVSFLRSIGALHNLSAKANWSGKVRTLISFPVICVIYYHLEAPEHWWPQISAYAVYSLEALSMAINAVSIWIYTKYYGDILKKEMRQTNNDKT
ncbi:MAG: CDP-alcohol phosphatidyltransferase family protein [Lentisphaerae bacterium]|nr:CDP-alcohol phosphatidyltransferase family protein [Lentisphaerota bacterium]